MREGTFFGWNLYPSLQIQQINPFSSSNSSISLITEDGFDLICPPSVTFEKENSLHAQVQELIHTTRDIALAFSSPHDDALLVMQ